MSLIETLRAQEQAIEKVLKVVPPSVLGARIQRARMAQQLSAREVANQAGLSKNSIARLEQGEDVRAITILKVCSVLGLHIERLALPEDESLARVHRLEDDCWYDMVDFGAGPISGTEGSLTREQRRALVESGKKFPLLMLKSSLTDGKILPSILELHQFSPLRSHPGEEFVFVLSGIACIQVGQQIYTLQKGESITFWASEPHSYGPGGDAPALVLSVRVNP
jgi:transcriptional regulator with XRE-family HTH domain